MAGDEQKSWLLVGEIASYCLVTPTTARRWIRRGKLPALRLPGGHYRVRIADFRDFLERNSMPVKEELFGSKSRTEGGDH